MYLTSKQFDLLFFLYRHKGQVFTKEQIYENVWGYDNAPDASNLSSFIRKLRLKIEPHPDNPQYIITVWGVGYKFSVEEKPYLYLTIHCYLHAKVLSVELISYFLIPTHG